MTDPNFDRIARSYRWLEYVTLGRTLERCRLHFLPLLVERTHALVLGDGDGRFLAELLARNPEIHADAIDTSAAMLSLLMERCRRAAPGADLRLQIHQVDALRYLAVPCGHTYDLVVTHFFLDCLTQSEVEALALAVAPKLAPQALWLVSDFRIPVGSMRLPAQVFVRSLYLAFRILAGLRIVTLPDYDRALTSIGLVRIAQHRSFFGLLATELWSR